MSRSALERAAFSTTSAAIPSHGKRASQKPRATMSSRLSSVVASASFTRKSRALLHADDAAAFALTRREALALPLPAAADGGVSARDWLGHTWRQLHLDAHFGQVANPYADFNADSAARILSDAGFSMISFFASCGAGYSYYPTEIGVRHPGLTRDYTGEMAAALKKRGIRILPYV